MRTIKDVVIFDFESKKEQSIVTFAVLISDNNGGVVAMDEESVKEGASGFYKSKKGSIKFLAIPTWATTLDSAYSSTSWKALSFLKTLKY